MNTSQEIKRNLKYQKKLQITIDFYIQKISSLLVAQKK